jgi:hypothetical protein
MIVIGTAIMKNDRYPGYCSLPSLHLIASTSSTLRERRGEIQKMSGGQSKYQLVG